MFHFFYLLLRLKQTKIRYSSYIQYIINNQNLKAMKKVILLAFAMIVTLTASAQHSVGSITLTPRVGINLANLAGDISNNNMKFGLFAGADAQYQLSSLVGLSAGAFYSMQGCEGSGDFKWTVDEINIPVVAHFYVAPNFALNVGLQPGIIVASEQKEGDHSTDVKSNMQSLELSIPIGASYEYQDFVFDARYNLGVSKVNKSDGSIRNSVFQLSVGYKFDLK